ncbi:hypothetical protein MGG_17905 [Pyricularia oryzae 70-15]|uniref:Uncharacterized protein n=1 Tax=Pyricularia oryzae (strain 70-15 / ATCC MYA-4617 / FGSC 8958) TaxID=242507 RepID=G4NLB0_PYRO7|nr:uncharacterized protein MGG_17905 [Pyricularia oryzae 70-15]EHA45994.1 hypothetical protein MGG_17905 [Pyricularia oryzae 70-15]KAI7912891.1 hypothetical protein M0657_010268 [Pyricularia oryzae]KAI7917813.1 hypothetical protein M9X92_007232 [Pyricularia oryzae]
MVEMKDPALTQHWNDWNWTGTRQCLGRCGPFRFPTCPHGMRQFSGHPLTFALVCSFFFPLPFAWFQSVLFGFRPTQPVLFYLGRFG